MSESTDMAWAAYDAAVRVHGRDSRIAHNCLAVIQQMRAFDEQTRTTSSTRWWEL